MSVQPYYADDQVSLYLGDCRELLPALDLAPAACVTDPPYGETSAAWDRWPDGWVDAVAATLPASASLWSFGSDRMWVDRTEEFKAGWKFAQSALWIKHNGSGPTKRDRLVKIHEWAKHWYRGRWGDLHHEWERVAFDGPDKGRLGRTRAVGPGTNRGDYSSRTVAYDDGTRQPRSVTFLIEAPSVRKQERHQDEKPLVTVIPLVRECTPPGGLVLDCFAGSGTTGVAAKLTGRRALLIEASEPIAEIAARRLAEDVLAVPL